MQVYLLALCKVLDHAFVFVLKESLPLMDLYVLWSVRTPGMLYLLGYRVLRKSSCTISCICFQLFTRMTSGC